MTPAEITGLLVTVGIAMIGFFGGRAIFSKLDELALQVHRLADEIGGANGLRERTARGETRLDNLEEDRHTHATPMPFPYHRG